MSPKLLTTAEAAGALRSVVSDRTLSRYVREGRLVPTATTPGGHYRWDLDDLRGQLAAMRTPRQAIGAPMTSATTSTAEPLAQPIVAAVIADPARGMLATWRRDGTPPVGFLTGEVEPGESPSDAMVREVKEEAGLRVVAEANVLAERIHPRTGRRMLYVVGAVIGNADPVVGDDDELSAVRWVPLVEAVAAMEPFGGMYPPVREHLAAMLGRAPQ
jgi:8-oxo-dGTP diphosphatase